MIHEIVNQHHRLPEDNVMTFIIYRFIAFLVGLGFSQLMLEKYAGYLHVYITGEVSHNIVPVWAFIIPGLLGVAFATKGWHDKHRNYERSFPPFLIGMLLNASFWVYQSSESRFQIASIVTPVFIWAIIAHRKKFFNSEEETIAARSARIVS